MKIEPTRLATLIGTWATTPGPLYGRLADAIAAAIDRGELPPGSVLPTERDLAERISVSRTTVVGAYGRLKSAGRLESRQGRGTWVPGTPEDRPAAERAFSAELYAGMLGGQSDLIELTAACPPPISLVTRVLAETHPGRWLRDIAGPGYLPAGLPDLREAVAEHLEASGVPTTPDEVIVTTGAHQAIGLATALLGAPGQSVLVEEATYPGALDIVRGAGMRPVGVALDGEGVLPDALESLLERVRPAFIYLVPSHQNPTGSVLPAARSRRVAELSARFRVPVVEDMALRHLEIDPRPVPAPIASHAPDASSMAIGSASKVLWGGLRVGWIRAARPVVERLMRLKIVADLGSPILAQALVAELLPHFDEAVAERRVFLAERYAALSAALGTHLPDWTWDVPRGGCTLWVRMPSGDARALGQVAQRCGVNVVPGQALSAEGHHEDRLRVPFVRRAGGDRRGRAAPGRRVGDLRRRARASARGGRPDRLAHSVAPGSARGPARADGSPGGAVDDASPGRSGTAGAAGARDRCGGGRVRPVVRRPVRPHRPRPREGRRALGDRVQRIGSARRGRGGGRGRHRCGGRAGGAAAQRALRRARRRGGPGAGRPAAPQAARLTHGHRRIGGPRVGPDRPAHRPSRLLARRPGGVRALEPRHGARLVDDGRDRRRGDRPRRRHPGGVRGADRPTADDIRRPARPRSRARRSRWPSRRSRPPVCPILLASAGVGAGLLVAAWRPSGGAL